MFLICWDVCREAMPQPGCVRTQCNCSVFVMIVPLIYLCVLYTIKLLTISILKYLKTTSIFIYIYEHNVNIVDVVVCWFFCNVTYINLILTLFV